MKEKEKENEKEKGEEGKWGERWGPGFLIKSLSGSCLPQVPESHRRRVPVVLLSPLAPMSPAGPPVDSLPRQDFHQNH